MNKQKLIMESWRRFLKENQQGRIYLYHRMAGEASINLLNRLDGRTSGGYVENYEDLLSEMKAIDGE